MPPKPRFTREEIVDTALDIVSRKGIEALTARELGEALGSSARPIFTVFRSMEELQQEVRSAAMRRFESYAGRTMPGVPLFKQVGMQMVLFGAQEPKRTICSSCAKTAAPSALTMCSVSWVIRWSAASRRSAATMASVRRKRACCSSMSGSTRSESVRCALRGCAGFRRSSWGGCSPRSFRR